MNATVVGGGLAGSEAAWALAERGVRVTLYEMRPVVPTPAHRTDRLAELVCSNSFKSVELTNAHGLLKAELRALGSLLLPCADEARVPGGTALAVDREIFSRAVHERVTGHPNITVVREEVAELPVAGRGRDRAAHLGAPGRRHRRAARRGGARVLRRDRADASRTTRSITSGCTPSPATARASGDDYLNAPLDAPAVRGVHRRADRGRPAPGPRVRPGALLRGLSAGRGDGAPRPGDAALRADEAGGAARSAHRPRAVRGGAAPAGGPRRPDVEPGRLPDPAPHPGAAAGVPDDSRARARRSSCATGASTGTRTSTAPPLSAPPSPRGTTTGSSSPASSPASRATPSRSAPACSPASTSRAGCAASRSPCRRRPRCSARSTAICARPIRSISSR